MFNVTVEMKEEGFTMLTEEVKKHIDATKEGFSASVVEVALFARGFNLQQRQATMARLCKALNVHVEETEVEGMPARRFQAGFVDSVVAKAEAKLDAVEAAEFSKCPNCGEEIFDGETCICQEVEAEAETAEKDETAEVAE